MSDRPAHQGNPFSDPRLSEGDPRASVTVQAPPATVVPGGEPQSDWEVESVDASVSGDGNDGVGDDAESAD